MDATETSIYFAVVLTLAAGLLLTFSFVYFSLRLQKRNRMLQRIHTEGRTRGQEEERQRVAEELHDGVNTMLTGLKFMMHSIPERKDERQQYLGKVNQCIDDTISSVRYISVNLRPPFAGRKGLEAAILKFISSFPPAFENRLHLEMDRCEAIPTEKQVHIYRIVQELICNGFKHAGESIISISIKMRRDQLLIHYADNGPGIQNAEHKGQGLVNMRNRAGLLGGRMIHESHKGRGSQFLFIIPLKS